MKPVFEKYSKQLYKRVADLPGFWMTILGMVGNRPIWLLRSRDDWNHKDPRILIASGFHGEEQAGPWAILKWLENDCKDILKKVDISFLPVVNPTGFNIGRRYNTWGEKDNCGFCHKETTGDVLSKEGDILMSHKELLVEIASDGFLSLHEDCEVHDQYYMYSFEKTQEPGQFSCKMLETLADHFSRPVNGVSVTQDAKMNTPPFVVNGLVYKYCDGSFEDFLFHEGVPIVVVTETPSLRCRLSKRVDANVDVIERFAELTVDRSKKRI